MKKLIISIVSLLMLSSCANSQGDVFGRKADTGALLGGMVGAVVGAHNGNAIKGALIGAGAGLAAGAVADANDARQNGPATNGPVPNPPSPEMHSSDIVVKEAPVVVVETPVVIDERIWVGNDLWIYSYHGFRGPNGHIRYGSRVPFHRVFIRGGVGYRR